MKVTELDDDVVAEYAYDAVGLGRRTSKTVGSDVTRYVYAGLQSVEELDGSDALLRVFAFGDRIDQVVMMEAADDLADVDGDSNTTESMRFFFHTQLIGSVTHVTAAAQTVVERYEYDPYGAITIKDQSGSGVSSSPIGNTYSYTGRQFDSETGLYYYRARQYSPTLQRFVQRDPLEYIVGPNALSYVVARPSVAVDPHGLAPDGHWTPPGGVGGGGSYRGPEDDGPAADDPYTGDPDDPPFPDDGITPPDVGGEGNSKRRRVARPPGTKVIWLDRNATDEELAKAIRDAESRLGRSLTDAEKEEVKRRVRGGGGYTPWSQGDDWGWVCIVASGPTSARLLKHELGHAWLVWWIRSLWLYWGKRHARELNSWLTSVSKMYDAAPEPNGGRTCGSVPSGPIPNKGPNKKGADALPPPITVPRTDHGTLPPYGVEPGDLPPVPRAK